jgi:GH25 family lysozyme M1 (1,4-beta-N-acetylmuramidase)
MRLLSHIIALSALSAATIAAPLAERASYTQGIDYVNFQLAVDWTAAAAQGVAFAYIQATHGSSTCLEHIIPAAFAALPCRSTAD